MRRFTFTNIAFWSLMLTGCARPWSPPAQNDPVPTAMIQVHTSDGWVTMPADEAAAYFPDPVINPKGLATLHKVSSEGPSPKNRQLGFTGYQGSHSDIALFSTPQPAGPHDSPALHPITPQQYYSRPEYTSTGYIPGHYGRVDNFTPGEHSSTGYTPGNYRADGLYTRPEHTSTGFILGNWQAQPYGPSASPPSRP